MENMAQQQDDAAQGDRSIKETARSVTQFNNNTIETVVVNPAEVYIHGGQTTVISTSKGIDKNLTALSDTVFIFNKKPLSDKRTVFKGRQLTVDGCFRDIAVKRIEKTTRNKREIKLLTELEHKNIVRLYCTGQVEVLGCWFFIAMELCDQDLKTYIEKNDLDFPTKQSCLKQIVEGLVYIHSKKVAHRDLKPGNVLISKGSDGEIVAKLADFGISAIIPDDSSHVTDTMPGAGTYGYTPPELYQQESKIRLSFDIFPLGLVATFIFTKGKHAYGEDQNMWKDNINNNANLDLSIIQNFAQQYCHKKDQLVQLINKMLQHSPVHRPTATQIRKDIFFTDIAVDREKKDPPDEFSEQQLLTTSPSIQKSPVIILFDQRTRHLHELDPTQETVTKKHPYKHEMHYRLSVAGVVENHVYVLAQNRSVYRLDYFNPSAYWETRKKYDICHGIPPTSVCSEDSIFLIGGPDSKAVSRYHPEEDRWECMKERPSVVLRATLLVSKGKLYSFGGELLGERVTNRVLEMDVEVNEWTRLPDMIQSRSLAAATDFKGRFYVAGGDSPQRTTLDSVEVYCPKGRAWTMLNMSLFEPLKKHSLYAIEDSLFVIMNSKTGRIKMSDNCEWAMITKINMLEIEDSTVISK